MGLVDYSDSDSDTEAPPAQQAPKPHPSSAANAKKPFQKLIDRSGTGTGKIVVQLPTAASSADSNDAPEGPPAKRAKTTTGGSRFSGFGSLLPPPKKTAMTAGSRLGGGSNSSSSGGAGAGNAPAPGVHLRTAAEPAFIRRAHNDDDDDAANDREAGTASSGLGLNLPAPKRGPAGPTIPEGQKPEEEVKLVGKPLMFKPLSVSRKPVKKKAGALRGAKPAAASAAPPTPAAAEEAPRKKVSLFSMDDDEDTSKPTKPMAAETEFNGVYQPLFSTDPTPSSTHDDDDHNAVTGDYASYLPPSIPAAPTQQQSLTSIVDDMQLSASARRELFGRRGGPSPSSLSTTTTDGFVIPSNARVVNFNMEAEYEHNEAIRQSGAEQAYNPVRSIAPGKHSLRQMVNMAQSNQTALEDGFAQGKNNRKDAAGRYGWK